ILETRSERFVGDVASFYLPYVEEAIRAEPGIRIVCLKRPREEVVEGFCRFLDQATPFPVNHWVKEPAPGVYHDPLWTRIFPQYDTQNREEGIRRYWHDVDRLGHRVSSRQRGPVAVA
ncbi:MAG: class I SAM-dependent methyltransferase, partial [Pirellulales bacterium]|nr:class I SAM-dependent methyltransferase [Pirellulales bacterium]